MDGDSAVKAPSEPYGHLHKIVLQGMMASGFLEAKGVQALFKSAVDLLRYSQEEKEEKIKMNYVQKVIRSINDEIKMFNMAIRSATCELTATKFLIFMVTVEKPIAKMQMMFSKAEVDMFQKCMNGMLRKYDNFSLPMTECINTMKTVDSRISLTVGEAFINKMIELQYFTKNTHKDKEPGAGKGPQFDVTLGVRGLREFEPVLIDLYRDVLKTCSLCKVILLHGVRCPGCKIYVHRHCVTKFLKDCQVCKNCSAPWDENNMQERTRATDEPFEDNDNEDAVEPTAGSSRQEVEPNFQPPPTPGTSRPFSELEKMPILAPQTPGRPTRKSTRK